MTQPGETDDYSVSDHVEAILKHSGYDNIIETVFVNDTLPANFSNKYKSVNAYPAKLDFVSLKKFGIKVVAKKLIEENKDGLVRHSPKRLARAIYHWYRTVNKNEEDDSIYVDRRDKEYQFL